MTIEEQFNMIAQEYDANRRRFIPCFDDYYINTTKLILSNGSVPKRVLDLGSGTGLLTYYWYRECKKADYVLLDIADDMLRVSKKRFEGLFNVDHMVMDYTKQLPEGEFDTVISALSIHHLEDSQKESLFARIYDKLPKGGIFVNYDQFCAGTTKMNQWFDSYWEEQLYHSDLTQNDIELWKERRKLDKECSVEKEIEMLQKCSFSVVKCLYSYHKFSVIMAVKS
ncbi:MAG TPA: class I SAM-dependent methyltransferase [Lachnospiraceae bacterium]|nr:class I SAM-dependent methyltransferase [Lachnospiraceae bacterium]HPF29155.1 class I SAM-dependent methyltransferase [Lachnospiraceae bacterium]